MSIQVKITRAKQYSKNLVIIYVLNKSVTIHVIFIKRTMR